MIAAAEPTARERLIAKVVGAKILGRPEDHETLLDSLMLPPQLAAVAKRVGKEVPDFLPKFLVAVDPARDLTSVWPLFAVWLLRDVALPAVTVDKLKCREAIERVAAGYESGEFAVNAYAAADAAYAAAYAAAASSAASAASAASSAAAAAADAASSAAYAAADAAYAAAYAASAASAAYAAAAAYAASAAYQRMANKLLELITEGATP